MLSNPVLPFLVFWKIAQKTTKKTRIFYPYRTPKIPGKEGENARKNKEFLAAEKTRNSKKKQGKEGQGKVLGIPRQGRKGNIRLK